MKVFFFACGFLVFISCKDKSVKSVQKYSKPAVEISVKSDSVKIPDTPALARKQSDRVYPETEGLKKDLKKKNTASSPKLTGESTPAYSGPGEADAAFQWDANQKLEKLLKHFGKNTPDYYAGAVINDKGNLVISIKGNLEQGKAAVTKIIGKDNVLFQSQKYSHAELTKLMDHLNDFARNPENKQYSRNMKMWQLNEYKNVVEMGLQDTSPEKIAEFKKHVSNSPAIIFFQTDGIVLQ